ncbi:hypothetical protein CASFOL_040514 [Castilleja foliolosa]|uniref:WPP domain-interacting protein 1 n=1 Tax=Castilleja foliolosa TaxID=1961234 RepID=A0ABD3BCC3_9LAMI
MDLVNNTLVRESNGLLPDVNGKENEASISPATRKGYGLKKWRRIKRDATRSGGDSSDDTGHIAMQDLSNSVRKPSKRFQVLPEKSEGSVSSPNPIAGNSVDAGRTESENSEDQSSKSSTAVSAPKMRYEFSNNDKNGMSSLSGSNSTQHLQQQGKGRVEPSKKARGVKIEKENSRSSVESDLRSSNFVFAQGAYVTSNGKGSEGLENGHEDNLSWDGKKEKGGNCGSSSDRDALVESILVLQKAQEALEEEVLKFKEIGKDASKDGSVSDDENVSSFSRILQSEVLETAKREAEAELEDLFKQRIETEIEYLTISRAIQKLSIADVNLSTISEEQNSTASKLPENKTGDKATAMLGKDADKFQKLCEDIASGNETMKLQKGVCKYTSYFLVQLLSLFVIFGIFIFGLSADYVELVPT